jgi:phage gp46-like protein
MASYAQDLAVTIDGVPSSLLSQEQPLVRAVVISLFTWRRALPGDAAEGQRWGWWGDGIEGVTPDRIGSRLWLLAREKLTATTIARAKEYAEEALAWMVEDRVATKVTVTPERLGTDGLALRVTIARDSTSALQLRFDNAWSLLNGF